MKLDAGCHLTFEAIAPSPLILMVRPRTGVGQLVMQDEILFEPNIPIIEYTDSYGNLCQRLLVPPGIFHAKATATVETPDFIDVQPGAEFVPVQELPDYTLQFLLPSRYCQADLMRNSANKIVAGVTSAYDQVEAIRHWVYTHVEYRYETSDTSTSALETEKTRVGVCRDFAHLGIALCRSLTIPARMVVGYLYQLEPMDFHAWFEAFVGGRWYTFDATQAEPKGNRIAIAYGRDAVDVALATQFGPSLTTMKVWVSKAEDQNN
ncbi:transglutaminase family protein [Leptolyngbya sp. FACHB-16]|uniref:transglutaminase-like domain-containing protein n=1 Tax=unclassified Leptolyngbya TaxID=2650499 RepID=UPI0016854FA6|nr:transglutaminase family protein [Leptolyngbya sp. FACHB-16]MBD2158880.1 transglutaminase family protein [Leptolyngbya sp. FACHB-16]